MVEHKRLQMARSLDGGQSCDLLIDTADKKNLTNLFKDSNYNFSTICFFPACVCGQMPQLLQKGSDNFFGIISKKMVLRLISSVLRIQHQESLSLNSSLHL